MPSRTISIRGARTHNLKNVDVDIPQRQLTVLTGPSGSGKSSLAFNTLYAEGQRRFVESMSTYVRQFLERIDRPDIDEITGILPAIAIEQRNTVKNARSTVATATELADHIRLFMTYAGETICPDCQVTVRRETPESITTAIIEALEGKRVVVLAPIFFEKQNRGEVLTQLVKAGYSGVLPSLMSEQFPVDTRAVGVALGYSVSVSVFGGLAPLVAEDEVVEVRDLVVDRTPLVAERDAAIHAARSLLGHHWRRQRLDELGPCLQARVDRLIGPILPLDLKEAGGLAHRV